MLVYPDTCVLIYLIEEHPSLAPQVESAIRAAPTLCFALSELLRLECRVSPMKQGDFALLAKFDRFFQTPHTFLFQHRGKFLISPQSFGCSTN